MNGVVELLEARPVELRAVHARKLAQFRRNRGEQPVEWTPADWAVVYREVRKLRRRRARHG